MPDSRVALCVAGLFLLGAALIRAIHVVQDLPAARRRRDWVKYGVYVAVINGLWACAYLGRAAASIALGAIVMAGAVEASRIVKSAHRLGAAVLAALLLSAALGHLLIAPGAEWSAGFAFVVVVTAATDSFAELTGRLMGGRKLCPRLSPGKTVAGLCGGLIAAVAVSCLLGFLLPTARGVRLALLGLGTALGAVGGDLLFSAIKRVAGVKDFSGLLPGHGGVLDRFDSLIVAAPVFHWSRVILERSSAQG